MGPDVREGTLTAFNAACMTLTRFYLRHRITFLGKDEVSKVQHVFWVQRAKMLSFHVVEV